MHVSFQSAFVLIYFPETEEVGTGEFLRKQIIRNLEMRQMFINDGISIS